MISSNVKQMAPREATEETGGDELSACVFAAGWRVTEGLGGMRFAPWIELNRPK